MLVYNHKTKKFDSARCRHCKFFQWSNYRVYTGYCFLKHCFVANNQFACSNVEIKEWLLPPVVVQLNLFTDEKSV